MNGFRITTLLFASAALLMAARPASAGPLEPAGVPADAKWVIHVDFDKLSETVLAERVRTSRPGMVKLIRHWLQQRYGIDPRDDLHDVTMFSDTYEAHTGVVVLRADYDAEKARAQLQKQPQVKTETYRDHTLYTFSKYGKKKHGEAKQDFKKLAAKKPAPKAVAPKAGGDRAAVVLIEGGTAVFASSHDRAKAAVDLLMGDAPSLKEKQSDLITDTPEGTVVYGAAIELAKIKRHDGAFPILSQHERIVWVGGERDGKAFKHVTWVAQSEEVAQQMKQAFDGFVAFLKLWADDSEALSQIADQIEITIDGATIEKHYEGDSETVIAALRDLLQRIPIEHRAK